MSKQRDAYVRKMKKQIDDLNADIDGLQKKSEKASKDMQAKYKEQIKKTRHSPARSITSSRSSSNELSGYSDHACMM